MDGALGGAICGRLPQLNRVAFRIVEASETAIRIRLRVYRDLDSGGAELRNHRIELTDPEVHHPHPTTVPKVWSVDGERSEEHTSELQSPDHLVCRLLLEKKNNYTLMMMSIYT